MRSIDPTYPPITDPLRRGGDASVSRIDRLQTGVELPLRSVPHCSSVTDESPQQLDKVGAPEGVKKFPSWVRRGAEGRWAFRGWSTVAVHSQLRSTPDAYHPRSP